MQYETKSFTIPTLEGISEKTIDVHLGLYAGYVKHTNLTHEQLADLSKDAEKNAYAIAEIQRRLGFEFCGMRNHEYYFEQFEGGAAEIPDGAFKDAIEKQWGSTDTWIKSFKQVAGARGIGWTILYRDPVTGGLLQTWVDEHHEGMLGGVDIILALDMWEHAYMTDLPPSQKKEYVESFFKNLNWDVVAKRLG